MTYKQLEFSYERPHAHQYAILDMLCEIDDPLEATLYAKVPTEWTNTSSRHLPVPGPNKIPYGEATSSGNPYAKIGAEGGESGAQPQSTHRYAVLAGQCGHVDPLEAQLHVQSKPIWKSLSKLPVNTKSTAPQIIDENNYRSGNPYANIFPDNTDSAPKETISKIAFRRRAARIFRQYSPSTGKSRPLRPEFTHFIDRNASKSPKKRLDIINRLTKYDLESSGFQGTVFNRELSDHLIRSLDKLSED